MHPHVYGPRSAPCKSFDSMGCASKSNGASTTPCEPSALMPTISGMNGIKPLRPRNGNQYLDKACESYRYNVRRKLDAYHRFALSGIVAQSILQYLACAFPRLVWAFFGSWIRTIRPGIPPSEMVAAIALRNTFPHFLTTCTHQHILTKFICDRTDPNRSEEFRLAA